LICVCFLIVTESESSANTTALNSNATTTTNRPVSSSTGRAPVLTVIPVGIAAGAASDQISESAQLTPQVHPEIPPASIISEAPAKHSVEVTNSVEDEEVLEMKDGGSSNSNDSKNKSSGGLLSSPGDPSLFPSLAAFRPRPVSILSGSSTPIQVKRKQNVNNKQPGLSQTTFNHNNHALSSQEQLGTGGGGGLLPLKKYSDMKLKNKKPPVYSIPTCCNFSPDVNDGFTHHCRNRRMELPNKKPSARLNDGDESVSYTPTWNVPKHFMSRDKSITFS